MTHSLGLVALVVLQVLQERGRRTAMGIEETTMKARLCAPSSGQEAQTRAYRRENGNSGCPVV
jgi:hypothetical protein